MIPQNEPTLHVLTGLHAGAAFVLRDGAARIGSGGDANIILADEGVLGEHAVLETAKGGLRLTALADGVALDGCPILDGGALAAAAPFEFEVAGVRLRCEGPPMASEAPGLSAPATAPDAQPPRGGRRIPVRPAIFGAVLGIFVTVGLAVRAAVPASGHAPRPSGVPSVAAAAPAAADAGFDPGTVRRELGAKLAEAGLTGLQLAVNGAVATVSGRLDPASLPRWQAVEAWADRRYGRRVLLVPAVAVEAERPATIAVDAVWNGPEPCVVVRGERYVVGATLPSGWRIEAIEAQRVLVQKEGRTHALPF